MGSGEMPSISTLTTCFYNDYTVLYQSIQIDRNADRLCNDADNQRNGQLDAHEDKHG